MHRRFWMMILTIVTLLATAVTPGRVFAQNPGGLVAFAGQDGNIYFYHTDGSGLDKITNDGYLRADMSGSEPEVEYMSLSWSPDGRYLAAIRQQSEPKPDRLLITQMLMVYDTHSSQWRQTGKELHIFSWNPSSTGLVYSLPVSNWGNKGPQPPFNGIFQYDLNTGQDSEILPPNDRPLSYPSFSRTGRYLVYYEVVAMEGLGYFGIHDFQTQASKVWSWDTNFSAASLNWAADDSFVVFDQNIYTPQQDSKIYRASPTFEDVTVISPSVEGRNFYGPRLSPNQERVLAMSDRINPNSDAPAFGSVWIFNLDGSQAREVVTSTTPIYSYRFLGDGYMIYSSGDYRQETIQIVDLDSGQTSPLGRGREFAVQPGAGIVSTAATATPQPVNTAMPTGQPIAAVTATPAALAQAVTPAPTPPDRVLPSAPAWFTPSLLGVLLCGGALALLLVIVVVFLIVRKR